MTFLLDIKGGISTGWNRYRNKDSHTTLAVGAERTRLGPTVALAALRSRDSVDTLISRTVDQRMVAAE